MRTLLSCILFISVASLPAKDVLPIAKNFTNKLGWTFTDAKVLGEPKNMFVYRGETSEEDNIVFFYPDSLYLFWFRDHVWQVRVDERWEGEIDGVRIGMKRRKVESLWGQPINRKDENPTWTLPDQGYPCRIRLFFRDNHLVDIYVYRSDW